MVILTDQSFLLFLANTIPVVPASAADRVRYHRARVVDIGKKLGISESTVRRILRENGV